MTNDTQHFEDFSDLMTAYHWPLAAWATGDLVRLANIIDIELQQRAAEDQDAIYNAL
jgi:hypothetical protein